MEKHCTGRVNHNWVYYSLLVYKKYSEEIKRIEDNFVIVIKKALNYTI